MTKFNTFIALSSFSVLALAADIGSPGEPSSASREVEISLYDIYFMPESLSVKPGETLRLRLVNRGNLLHQFTIGTPQMHAAQQAEMAVMMDHGMISESGIDPEAMHMDHGGMGMGEMTHDAPNTTLVPPGQTAELVWTFPQSGTLEFACNLPGNYDVGMVASIAIEP